MSEVRIHPAWDKINSFKTQLTKGERFLAEYLDEYLPEEWEIFVQPYLNGDRPDIVIGNQNVGIIVYEVKDWNLELYNKKKAVYHDKTLKKERYFTEYFVTTANGNQRIPSPIKQAHRYIENLTNLYIPRISSDIQKNPKNKAAFAAGLYFHNGSSKQLADIFQTKSKYLRIFCKDDLAGGEQSMERINPFYGRNRSYSPISRWYPDIRFWLTPPYHSIEQGTKITLSSDQRRHIAPAPGTHQRLRGVAGSGKTLVIAQRAANIASQGKKVLIITYNITLWHYIRDQISRARFGFEWDMIEFTHFHGLIKNYLSENGIKFPENVTSDDEYLDNILPSFVVKSLNRGINVKNRKYDAILIDEGQDFCRSYYDMLMGFMTKNDEILFVMDERQNLYKREYSWVDSMTNSKFRGPWRLLKESYRLPERLLAETNRFANQFLPGVGATPEPIPFQGDLFAPHYLWRNLNRGDSYESKIRLAYNWLTEGKKIHPSDIIVLVHSHSIGWKLVKSFKPLEVNHVFEEDSESPTHKHKMSFWMGDSRLKMSTIHSFKGWELTNVILLITPLPKQADVEAFDNMIYTSMTRTRSNLIVFNLEPRFIEYGNQWPSEW
jgi:KaiC/GvpD/RAD55 family RecA-like ATPase